jgi:hypothetical protein
VHATVGVGADGSNRRTAADKFGGLDFIAVLLFLDRARDLFGYFEYRALGARAERMCSRRSGGLLGVEYVTLLADVDLRLEVGNLEMVAALLEHLPECDVRVAAMLGKILWRHPEWISLYLERFLTAEEGIAA